MLWNTFLKIEFYRKFYRSFLCLRHLYIKWAEKCGNSNKNTCSNFTYLAFPKLTWSWKTFPPRKNVNIFWNTFWECWGWDDWMASPARWTWVWASFGSWWWTGEPGVLQSMGSQRVRRDWVTELNWLRSVSCSSVIPLSKRMLLLLLLSCFSRVRLCATP